MKYVTNTLFSESMFASTFVLSVNIKIETYKYESLVGVQLLILGKFADMHGLFANMCTTTCQLEKRFL
jgi:hypothetical protein